MLTLYLQKHSNDLSGTLVLCIALVMINKVPEAKQKLINLTKQKYNILYQSVFEDAYVLLSDLHIQQNEFDKAKELCLEALKHNRSCFRVFQYF